MAAVALAGLLAGGLLWWASDGEGDDGGAEPYCGIAGDRERAARIAFFEAGHRLLQAGSFAYRGEMHAAELSSFPLGGWTAGEATVEGTVVPERGLTRDIAVYATGRAVETVTSGPDLWTRSASTAEALGAEPWAFRTSAGPLELALGPTAMLHLVLSARHPGEEAPDGAGRCVIRATVPTADPYDVYGELLAGANVLLTLDEDRNIARIIVRSAPDDPELVVELDVARVDEPRPSHHPTTAASPRRTVPVAELDAAGAPRRGGAPPYFSYRYRLPDLVSSRRGAVVWPVAVHGHSDRPRCRGVRSAPASSHCWRTCAQSTDMPTSAMPNGTRSTNRRAKRTPACLS